MENETENKVISFVVPKGWWMQLLRRVLIALVLLASWPFYWNYIRLMQADSILQSAKIEAEAKKITGECIP